MRLVQWHMSLGAPWAFAFEDQRTATANIAASGVLVMVFAIWAMLRDLSVGKMKEEHRQAAGTR